MQLSLMPLHILGAADLDLNHIVLSTRQSFRSLIDTFRHELAHLIVRDNNHSQRWEACYHTLGGSAHCHHHSFDRKFTNIGYIANIGNISGIQNI